MPKRHAPEVKAAAIAAVASGEQPSEVAKRFGISAGRLHEWCKQAGPLVIPERSGIEQRSRERMGELIYDTLFDLLSTVRVQLRAAAREEWLAEQNAGDVAQLLGTEFDRAIRLLAGLRPVEPDPEPEGAPAVVDGVARPADDGPGVIG